MSMYIDHFGLREAPFGITPHTEFFFAGANRGSTLDALLYAITQDEGIVKVTGEVGSGKTMLCRMVLEKLPANIATVYLANPSLTRDEILFALADELEMSTQPPRIHQLLRGLQTHLVKLYGDGKQVVVLIDEAHAMPVESLEEVRLLSNLESSRHKLLKIVLFGQPELDDILARNEIRQLRERVTHNFALEPLKQGDVGSYLMFRMRAAGYHGPDLFTASAIRLISTASLGLSRRINILADKALLAAFVDGEHQVDVKQAHAAIKDAAFGVLPGFKSNPLPRRALLAAGALAVAAIGAGMALMLRDGLPGSARNPVATAPSLDSSSGTAERTPGETAVTSAAAPIAGAPSPATPATTAAAPRLPPSGVGAIMATGSADAPLPLQASVELAAAPGVLPASSGRSESGGAGGPLTREKFAAFGAWISGAPDGHWFIQLSRTNSSSLPEIEHYLQQVAAQVDAEQLRLYRARVRDQEWVGVIYGEYPSYELAASALNSLPASLREAGAYPRAVRMLK